MIIQVKVELGSRIRILRCGYILDQFREIIGQTKTTLGQIGPVDSLTITLIKLGEQLGHFKVNLLFVHGLMRDAQHTQTAGSYIKQISLYIEEQESRALVNPVLFHLEGGHVLSPREQRRDILDLQPERDNKTTVMLSEDLPLTAGNVITLLLDGFFKEFIVIVREDARLKGLNVLADKVFFSSIAENLTQTHVQLSNHTESVLLP